MKPACKCGHPENKHPGRMKQTGLFSKRLVTACECDNCDCVSYEPNPPKPVHADIVDLVPEELQSFGYCESKRYRDFERQAVVYLRTQGWQFPAEPDIAYRADDQGHVHWWYAAGDEFITTDGDDFGPLVRVLFGATSPAGVLTDIWHG